MKTFRDGLGIADTWLMSSGSAIEAKKLLNSRELEEFRWDIDQYLKYAQENTLNRQWTKQLENASIRYRVSRLEALKVQTQHTLEKLFGNQLDHIDELLKAQYLDNYYRTLFEVQKGFNIGWDVAAIDERQLRQILSKPWTGDNRTFSDRIWNRKQDVINETHKMLTQNILMGNHPSVGINKLKEKLGTTKHAATRLIMTESAYFANAAQLDVYKELNVEMFEILATLDCRTCDICGELDGRVIKTAHFQSGVTVPPFHPFCRCTTVPHIPDDFGERIARDKDGKTYYVPTDMKFNEWKEKYVDSGGMSANNDSKIQWPEKDHTKVPSNEIRRDLHEYANSRDVIIEGIRKADVDVELVKEMIDAAGDVLDKFPELKGEGKRQFTLRISTLDTNDFAGVEPSSPHMLRLNEAAMRSKSKLAEEYKKLADEGWFVRGTDYKSIIYHEMGHMFEMRHKIDGLQIAQEIFGNISKAETKKILENNLSQYSTDRPDEVTSEIFSAYFTGRRDEFILNFMKKIGIIN